MIAPAVAQTFAAATVSSAGNVMQEFVRPVMLTLVGLASLVCVFFLVTAGISYITSTGKPDKLEHAKKVLRNAIIGLVIVIAAGTLTSILSHAYGSPHPASIENLPSLTTIEPPDNGIGIVDVLIKAIVGLFKHIIESAASPFLKALDFFTKATPLMAENSAVFKLWLTVVGITDALFVLVVALLGFHIMSAASLGLDEIEFKHLLPQLALTFLLINTSIFAIDAIISLSNGMINALMASFGNSSVWDVLSAIASQAGGLGLVALMIMVVFLILAVILLVYYVMRLVVLYLGAILSPLVVLLWLVPGFKDFASTAVKTYLTTVFVLFVHVVILMLAASLFGGLLAANPDKPIDPIMGMIVGVAALITLLKTQGVMMQLSYVSVGPRALRKLGSQFMTGVSYTTNKIKTVRATRPLKEAK
jgi:hypothetical protein